MASQKKVAAHSGTIDQIKINDRLTMRYLKTGEGPPLVLMHTIRTQLEYFRELIPLLASEFTVYAVDLPGHGRSSIDRSAAFDEPYFRRAVSSFIRKLDLKDVILAGESIGAVLALTVANNLEDRVAAVISSNPYDYDLRYGDGVRRGNWFANLVIGSFAVPVIGAINAALENRIFLGIILRGGFHDKRKLPRDLLIEFDRTGRRRGYRMIERKTFAGWRSWGVARHLYASVKAPVTFIYGDDDWSRDQERQRNVRAIPGSRLISLRQTGHFAALERHEAVELVKAREDLAFQLQQFTAIAKQMRWLFKPIGAWNHAAITSARLKKLNAQIRRTGLDLDGGFVGNIDAVSIKAAARLLTRGERILLIESEKNFTQILLLKPNGDMKIRFSRLGRAKLAAQIASIRRGLKLGRNGYADYPTGEAY